MAKHKNVELIQHGLKCDNPKCEWKDDTINSEDYEQWIDKPCPLCGENVLTIEDYKNVEMIIATMDIINSIPPDVLKEMNDGIDLNSIMESDLFKGAEGLENLTTEGSINAVIDTHENIRIKEIKKR